MFVMTAPVTILPLTALAQDARLATGLDAVFFASSNTQTFANDATRAAFRNRWLGQYLDRDPRFAFVAMSANYDVVGYIVGSIDDPALAERFAGLAYFQSFKEWTRVYPAQLHVNVAPAFRGDGLGADLVAVFCAAVRAAGISGVHVVTSRGARNVSFYNRLGFIERGATGDGPQDLVFLGRDL